LERTGFSLTERKNKNVFHYATVTSEPVETTANQINAYLVDAPMVFIDKRTKPICKVSEMIYGNKPTDGGYFFFNEQEKNELLKRDPKLKELIHPFLGAYEFLNNVPRYCLWLKGVAPTKYNHSKEINERIQNIKAFREASPKTATQKLADYPTLFGEIRQPDDDYILIPRHSSERRKYIPFGFVKKEVVVGDSNMAIPNASLYEFGIITSTMHMAWTRYVCGRLKSDYRYSNVIVYNNFPWPQSTDKQKKDIEAAARGILDARAMYPDQSLSNLYDTNGIVPELMKAHQKLDKLVEKAYGKIFEDDAERVAYLFELYQKMAGELFVVEKKRGRRK
jgi:hypothetical protein